MAEWHQLQLTLAMHTVQSPMPRQPGHCWFFTALPVQMPVVLMHEESAPEHQLQPLIDVQEAQSKPATQPAQSRDTVPKTMVQSVPGAGTHELPGKPCALPRSHQTQAGWTEHSSHERKAMQFEPAGQALEFSCGTPPP